MKVVGFQKILHKEKDRNAFLHPGLHQPPDDDLLGYAIADYSGFCADKYYLTYTHRHSLRVAPSSLS